MGIHLNKHGGLTVSQKEQAEALGISEAEYKEYLIKRLEELRGGAPPVDYEKCRKINKLNAKNPVLVVGHGPSFRDYLDDIRNWKYTLVATDVCLEDLINADITPDYVVTSESSRATCPLYRYDVENLKGRNVQVIHSSITRNDVIEKYVNAEIPIRRFDFEEEVRCSNVGLFALNFAVHELKADKIAIVGFEHTGTEYTDYTYRVWQTDFWYFVRKWPKEIIINCSNGGVLYYKDLVLESTLEKLND